MAEICNGADDNCDGTVDDGAAATAATGCIEPTTAITGSYLIFKTP